MVPGFKFLPGRVAPLENLRQDFLAGLHCPFGPAALLGFEGVDLHGQFRRNSQIRQENEVPASHLGPIAEIQVLGQRVVLPASGIFNCAFSEDPSRAVEIEVASGQEPRKAFQHEVSVQEDGLDLGKERVLPVQVRPASLNHADLGVCKIVDRLPEKVTIGDEIRIEDGDKLPFCGAQPVLQCASLETGPLVAVDIVNVQAEALPAFHGVARNRLRFVGGIVQHLDVEPASRVVERADRVDHPFHDIHLVVRRDLNGDPRQLLEPPLWNGDILSVLVKEEHHQIAMKAVEGKDGKDDKIGRDDGHVKPIHRIEIRDVSRLQELLIG